MADGVQEFFDELAARRSEPLLRTVHGSVRFDVVGDRATDRWFLHVDAGTMTVTHGDGTGGEGGAGGAGGAGGPDCVIAGAEPLLDAICTGRSNAMAAILRGELACAGDIELFFAVQRLFPGPPPEAGATTTGAAHG